MTAWLSFPLRSFALAILIATSGTMVAAQTESSPGAISLAPPGAIQFENISTASAVPALSLTFAATGTTEIGDVFRLDGNSHFVGQVSVALTNAARRSEFPGESPLGYSHPITVTVYSVDRTASPPRAGQVLARQTDTFLIPWLPESGAAAGRVARECTITFDLGSLGLALPSEVIVAVSFDSHLHGRHPRGKRGPYDHLGVLLTVTPPAIGGDQTPETLLWNASTGPAGELEPSSSWGAYTLALRVQDSAYGVLFETAMQLEAQHGPDPRDADFLTLAASLILQALDREYWNGNNALSPYGEAAYELFADATTALSLVARDGALGNEAAAARSTLSGIAGYLADSAFGDALIVGGDADALLRAQAALDLAAEFKAHAQFSEAIDAFSEAWSEAHAALR